MKVEKGFFETLEPGSVPGFVIRVYVEGENFEHRAVPLLARVGDQPVEELFVAPDGSGFAGFLATTPNDGDRLFVRYADETEFPTNIVFGQDLFA